MEVLINMSHGNFSSGNHWTSGCHKSTEGIAAAETETKSETQIPPGRRDHRDSNIDPKRLKRFLSLSIFLYIFRVNDNLWYTIFFKTLS